MRVGLIGPSGSDVDALRRAIDTLLVEAKVDRVVYLGADGALEALTQRWTKILGGYDSSAFIDRAEELVAGGDAARIRALLEAEVNFRRLDSVAALPEAPAQALEMLDDRFVLFAHETADLDEDDIANVQIIIYGAGKQMTFRRFGPRAFFTPGPLSEGHLGYVESNGEGRLTITVLAKDGSVALQESLAARSTKMSVVR